MIGICLGFVFTGAATLSWSAEADYVLKAISKSSSSSAAMISTDPSLTIAQASTAPTKNDILRDIIYFAPAGQLNNTGLSVTIPKGTSMIVTGGGVLGLYLFLDVVDSAS